MLWFTAVLGVVYAVSLALRADARGFGRPDLTASSTQNPPPPTYLLRSLQELQAWACSSASIRPGASLGEGAIAFASPRTEPTIITPTSSISILRRMPLCAVADDDEHKEEEGLNITSAEKPLCLVYPGWSRCY